MAQARLNKTPIVIMTAALAGALPGAGAHAAITAKTMNISVTVANGCTLSVTDMNFGTLTAVTGTETAQSTVNVNCTAGTFYELSFLPTTWLFGWTRNSTLVNGASQINYTMSLSGIFGTGSGTFSIAGQLAATPNPLPGVYKSIETLYILY